MNKIVQIELSKLEPEEYRSAFTVTTSDDILFIGKENIQRWINVWWHKKETHRQRRGARSFDPDYMNQLDTKMTALRDLWSRAKAKPIFPTHRENGWANPGDQMVVYVGDWTETGRAPKGTIMPTWVAGTVFSVGTVAHSLVVELARPLVSNQIMEGPGFLYHNTDFHLIPKSNLEYLLLHRRYFHLWALNIMPGPVKVPDSMRNCFCIDIAE